MTAIDWIAFGILIGSLVLGLMRGFVREAFSLAAWIAAFFAARALSPILANYIPGLSQQGLRQVAAAVVIFILVLILAQLLVFLLGKVLKVAGLSGLDHLLGMLFGAGRAVVVLILLALVAGLTALPRSQPWQDSLVGLPLATAAQKVIPWLPSDLAALIRFK
jgi:membrane protein required for colicin V production